MSVELHDPLHDPEPEGWDEFVARQGLTASWAYPALRAASAPSRTPVVLGVFRERGRILGAVGGVYMGMRRHTSLKPPRRGREPIVLDMRLPGEGDDVSWHFGEDVARTEHAALLREFEREVRRWLGLGLAAVVYRQLTPGRSDDVARRGALVRDTVGTARLAVRWGDAAGWLASLGGSRRRNLRRRAKLIDGELSVVVRRGRTDVDPAELAGLAAGQQRRLQRGPGGRAPLSPGYFAELAGRDDVSFLTYADENGRVLAFSTMLHQPERLNLGLWGSVPVEEGGRGHLYYDHYLRAVRHAVEQGAKELTAGRGRLDVKTELGFQVVPMRVAVVPRWALG